LIFVYLLPRLHRTQLWRWYDWFLLRNRKWLPFSSTWVHPCFFCTVLVAHQFSSPGRLLLASLDERRPSSVYLSHFNFLLRNRLAKWSESWKEASMEGPLFRLFISSRSLFLKKIFSSEASWANEPNLDRNHVWKVLYKAWKNVFPIPHCTKDKTPMIWLFLNIARSIRV
jgi:hypothetical protein